MSEQAFTLYFDIKKDHSPTLGAVARAALAIEKMAGETLYLSEPGVSFEVLFDRSAPGSLRIISTLKGAVTKERLKQLAFMLATLITTNTITYFQTRGLDHLTEAISAEDESLTPEEAAHIAEQVAPLVERSLANRNVVDARRDLFSAANADPAVDGVGMRADDRDHKPAQIVPRSDFADYLEDISEVLEEPGEAKRERTVREEVVLDRPILSGSHRKWGFFGSTGKFSAYMEDAKFLEDLTSGKIDLNLSGGIILDVTRSIKEEKEGSIWDIKKDAITEVHSWRRDMTQADFILSHKSDDNDDDQ
ncbi:hypothetical protein [Salipiger bermudensis]|uniref:Uncharacterized protein n=1 Tax=Salipiger bermudensis (strain DSM 26914 / JCM 13377 / KCTC 12554 / HTCC2601) TaxID=314265 RepID=Q0FIA3_SALBH|nr:hypothetical protein [Salipiger bermudensis]EAU43913.1 hypothetical protein R2601_23880 [Salipiger bermudensis HTCC2601]